MYDHFHAEFEHEGKSGEIEGGFTRYPRDWEQKSSEEKRLWWRQACINWGMPATAVIKRIWLAR